MKKNKTFSRQQILALLRERQADLKKFGVKRIGLFGSFATGKHRRSSDIDLLVEFEKPSFDNFMNLADYLEKVLGRKVDILTPDGVKGIRVKDVAASIKRNVLYVQER
ncbi:MAG: nucleotidyltransferase family protein [Nitrospinota bacterium]